MILDVFFYVYKKKYPQFQYDFNHYIHETLTIEEFEMKWIEMLLKYNIK